MSETAWKLMPVDPTDDMDMAGGNAVDYSNPYQRDVAANVWAAMTAAAPAPSSPSPDGLIERDADEAVTFVFENLANMLGLEQWEIHDGTEEWEGDVLSTLYGILCGSGAINPETDELATAELSRLRAELEDAEAEVGLLTTEYTDAMAEAKAQYARAEAAEASNKGLRAELDAEKDHRLQIDKLLRETQAAFITEQNRAEAAEASKKALVEALTDARRQIEYLHGKFAETGSGNAVLAKIDAALRVHGGSNG